MCKDVSLSLCHTQFVSFDQDCEPVTSLAHLQSNVRVNSFPILKWVLGQRGPLAACGPIVV